MQAGLLSSPLRPSCSRAVVAKASDGDKQRVDWDREWNRWGIVPVLLGKAAVFLQLGSMRSVAMRHALAACAMRVCPPPPF